MRWFFQITYIYLWHMITSNIMTFYHRERSVVHSSFLLTRWLSLQLHFLQWGFFSVWCVAIFLRSGSVLACSVRVLFPLTQDVARSHWIIDGLIRGRVRRIAESPWSLSPFTLHCPYWFIAENGRRWKFFCNIVQS